MSTSREHSRLSLDAGSRSRSRRPASRPRLSRDPSFASIPYLPQGGEVLINPDGQIGEEAAELLQEFVHPHRHDTETTLIQEDIEEEEEEYEDGSPKGHDDRAELSAAWRQSLPWWKRPSPLWFLVLVPFSAVAMSATIAPRVEIYTKLACDAYRPEYTMGPDKTYELCAADPVVQKAVAKLSLAMTTTMGILGCLTTAWWGSLSDRYGRTRMMGFSVFGMLSTDISFILVVHYSKILPGGYWFLLFGPTIDGLLGGLSSVSAAIHAYMADCTEPAARSRVFSLFLGFLFTGMSVGPTLGSMLIRFTGQPLSVFYVAFSIHFLYAFLTWFIVPESLSPAQMAQSKKLHAEGLGERQGRRGGLGVWLKRVFGFLTPLTLLYPAIVASGENPLKAKSRSKDWSLLLLAAGYACVMMVMGSITSKMQYTTMTFGWTSERIGYWTSVIGAARALHLTVVLPLIIKFFQSKPPAIQLPVEPDEPLHPVPGSSSTPTAASPPKAAVPPPPNHHSPTFDLALARVSLCIEIAATLLTAFAPSGSLFTVYSAMGAFGSGFGPAVNSVLSTMYMRNGGKELGKLFGAISVIQALSSQVVGPSIYGVTYVRTVATFPKAIFFVTAGCLALSFVLLSCIRQPKSTEADEEENVAGEDVTPILQREETLVDAQGPLIIVEDEEDRGRKADVKSATTAVVN